MFHFRGAPHVHAFVNVAMNGDAPLSVGESLGENPSALEGAGVKRLFERAMQAELGTDFAYYDAEAVVGRLRKGSIRAGDIYVLESWQDSIAVVQVRGARLAPAFAAELRARGLGVEPERRYSIATTSDVADEQAETLGRVEASQPGSLLREVTVAHLRARGFASLGPSLRATPRPPLLRGGFG